MKSHTLKILQAFAKKQFDERIKDWEIRKDDRGFEVGDYLDMVVLDDITGKVTGHTYTSQITYIYRGPYGLKEGWCVLSTRLIARDEKEM